MIDPNETNTWNMKQFHEFSYAWFIGTTLNFTAYLTSSVSLSIIGITIMVWGVIGLLYLRRKV